jgi:hypothetical protein
VTHVIEPAASGRAKCRGCGRAIAKGELRFGERVPNPFADDRETTLWFHLTCSAYKRPEPLLETLEARDETVARGDWLAREARLGVDHRRLPRIDGAQRASTGRATCRSCRETIEKGTWRIKLVFYEQGRFDPSGFIHAGCAAEYFGHADVLDRLREFSGELTDADWAEIGAELCR